MKLWFPLEDSKDVVSTFHERVWREHEDTPTSYGMELSRLASIAFKGDRPRALKECVTKFRSNLPGAIKLKLQPRALPPGVQHTETDLAQEWRDLIRRAQAEFDYAIALLAQHQHKADSGASDGRAVLG